MQKKMNNATNNNISKLNSYWNHKLSLNIKLVNQILSF